MIHAHRGIFDGDPNSELTFTDCAIWKTTKRRKSLNIILNSIVY